jgi:hypothetical protein
VPLPPRLCNRFGELSILGRVIIPSSQKGDYVRCSLTRRKKSISRTNSILRWNAVGVWNVTHVFARVAKKLNLREEEDYPMGFIADQPETISDVWIDYRIGKSGGIFNLVHGKVAGAARETRARSMTPKSVSSVLSDFRSESLLNGF